ncbi:MAG: transporter, partial [Sneathiella sp.]
MKSLTVAVASLAMLGLVGGCTPVGLAVGGAATAGVVVAEERSVGDAVEDAGIKLKILDALLQNDEGLFSDVSTSVIEGRVLVTGEVEKPEDRVTAADLIWSV